MEMHFVIIQNNRRCYVLSKSCVSISHIVSLILKPSVPLGKHERRKESWKRERERERESSFLSLTFEKSSLDDDDGVLIQ